MCNLFLVESHKYMPYYYYYFLQVCACILPFFYLNRPPQFCKICRKSMPYFLSVQSDGFMWNILQICPQIFISNVYTTIWWLYVEYTLNLSTYKNPFWKRFCLKRKNNWLIGYIMFTIFLIWICNLQFLTFCVLSEFLFYIYNYIYIYIYYIHI